MAAKTGSKKPLTHWLNRTRMAASLGISTQAFDNWRVDSCARIGRETFYTVDAVLQNRLAKQAERLANSPDEQDTQINREQAEREKTLLTREQRIGQELKNAQTRRELAPVSLITWTLSNVGAQISAILESIPLKVKKLLPKLNAADIDHITREILKAQNVAARVTVDLDEYYDQEGAFEDTSLSR